MNAAERMARPLAEVDPEVYEAIQREVGRQRSQLELIASENFTSEAELAGQPGRLRLRTLSGRYRHGPQSGARRPPHARP